MNDAVLYTLAEVAMALAGFSGIAAAFRLRGKNAWSETELQVLWFLIIDSFLVVFLSLLPIPLYLSGVPQDILWTICTIVLSLWFIIGNLNFPRRERIAAHFSKNSIMTPLFSVVSVVGIIVVLGLWCSIFNILIPRGQGAYVGGLLTLLGMAAVEFLFFIARARRPRAV